MEGFAPVTVSIGCDGGDHRITWRDGALLLEDHDLDAEQALVSLGGEPPICVDVVEAWQQALKDPHMWISLAVAPRSGTRPSLIALRAQISQQMSALQARATVTTGQVQLPVHVMARMRAQERSRTAWRSQLIAQLPEELRAPLVATCVYEIERRWASDPTEAVRTIEYAFEDIIEAKAGWAMRESLASWAPPGGLVRLPLHVQFKYLPPGEQASLNVELLGGTALVDVGLPLRWIADVWARGVMLVDGCFVLDVSEARSEGTGLAVRAVRWERSRRAFVPVVAHAIVVRVDEAWTLAWTGAP